MLALHPGMVTAAGAQRRLQALMFNGHSRPRLAALLAMSQDRFRRLLAARYLRLAEHNAVVTLYDEMWLTPPRESTRGERAAATRARNEARGCGWVPPGAYDEDAMDDPAAVPVEGWRRPWRVSAAEILPDVAELVSWGVPWERIEQRMCMTQKALERARCRAGVSWADLAEAALDDQLAIAA
jgi:hypothetical protein